MNLPTHECRISDSDILRYRTAGHGPTKLVLVHGLAARSEAWTDLVPLFAPDRYTIYLLDLLGSGQSAKPRRADYSIRGHSRRLLQFLEREALTEVTLIGHSLGGAVVLLSCIEAMQVGKRDLIESMVVMGGPGFIQRLPLMAEILGSRVLGALFVGLYTPYAWVKMGLRMAYHDHRLVDREHLARYAPCYRERSMKRALVQTCRQLLPPDCAEISACYGELRLPVLLLWGRQDQIVPLSQGERLNRAIPESRLVVIEECGHNPQEEKPQETFEIIDRFATKSSR